MNENEANDQFEPLGTHRIQIDGDTLVLVVRGTMTFDDMRRLLDHFAPIKREHGALFILYDGRQCTGMDLAARKLGSYGRPGDGEANLRVAFGLPFTVRVLLNMLLRAQKILFNRNVHVHVFEHEKEAWAFFKTERDKMRKELALKKSL
jgi:hypothetical protein